MAVELPAIALGGPTGTAQTLEDRGDHLALGFRRRVVDEALGGDGCAHALVDDPGDLEIAVAVAEPDLDPVTDLHLGGGLGRRAVDADVAADAGVLGR